MTERARTGTRNLAAAGLLATTLLFGAPVGADEYRSDDAGNPLRIVAYIVHPVGVILDTLIFHPAYWIASLEPIKTLVGEKD